MYDIYIYIHICISIFIHIYRYTELFTYINTAYSRKDETRNGQRNAHQNSEWWGDFSQPQVQIKQISQFEFVRDTAEFQSNQNLDSNLYREIPRNLIFSILAG